VGVEGGSDLVDFGAVGADGFVEDLGGDAELVGPVGHVGGDLGVDHVGVVGAFGVFFVGGVGFVGFGFVVVLGHLCGLDSLRWMRMGWVGMYWATFKTCVRIKLCRGRAGLRLTLTLIHTLRTT
jgi:hypothetical protein